MNNTVTIGDPQIFAIESSISKILPRLSQLALGYFSIWVNGRRYGVVAPDATALACSYNCVMGILSDRRDLTLTDLVTLQPEIVAELVYSCTYREISDNASFLGLAKREFERICFDDRLIWAPDGDEAFDDSSYLLRLHHAGTTTLIAFQIDCANVVVRVESRLLDDADFYAILEGWRSVFSEQCRFVIQNSLPNY